MLSKKGDYKISDHENAITKFVMLNKNDHYKISDHENAITKFVMLNKKGHYKLVTQLTRSQSLWCWTRVIITQLVTDSVCIDRGNVICSVLKWPQMSKYRATELPQSCFNKNKTWYGYM